MIIKARLGMFETNSSSTHSLVFKRHKKVDKRQAGDRYYLCDSEIPYEFVRGEDLENWEIKFLYTYFRACVLKKERFAEDLLRIYRKHTGHDAVLCLEYFISPDDEVTYSDGGKSVHVVPYGAESFAFTANILTHDEMRRYLNIKLPEHYSEKSEWFIAYTRLGMPAFAEYLLPNIGEGCASVETDFPFFYYDESKLPHDDKLRIAEYLIFNDDLEPFFSYWGTDDYQNEIVAHGFNGNVFTIVFYDGTKLFFTVGDRSEPEFPSSVDVKITDKCAHGCPYCYENSTPDGKDGNADLLKLFVGLPDYCEITVGGGNPLESGLMEKLYSGNYCNSYFCPRISATINQRDFTPETFLYIREIIGSEFYQTFGAIGVSVYEVTPELISNIEESRRPEGELETHLPQFVFHVILGVISYDDLKLLYDKNIKLLIMGFKDIGRGEEYKKSNPDFEKNVRDVYDRLDEITGHFENVAFDNLAVKQLDIKNRVTNDEWEKYYLGEDGENSMYIDLVKGEYGISSYDGRRWKIEDGMSIREMFAVVRREIGKEV